MNRVRRALGVSILALLSFACSGERATQERAEPSMQPLPDPDSARLEPESRRQLQELRDRAEALRVDPATPAIELADALGRLGMGYLAADFPDAAEPCLLRAQTIDPDEFRWVYYLAHLYRGQGNAEEAVRYFSLALEQRPAEVAVLVWLGRTHQEQGTLDEARPLLETALRHNPDSASSLYALGQIDMAAGDAVAAVERFKRALELQPRASSVHYPLALAYRAMGETALAEAHLEQRGDVDLRPFDPWMDALSEFLSNTMVHTDRGGRAYAVGKWEAAIENFSAAVTLSPDHALPHVNLGAALYQAGREPEAVQHYEAALRIDPGHADALYSLGAMAENRGDAAAAVGFYDAALLGDPQHPDAHFRLGDLYRRTGKAERALPHYRAVLAFDPREARARLGQAMAYVRLRRYEDARQSLERSIEALPDQPAFVHALARLLAASPDAALRDGERAMLLLRQIAQASPSTDLVETLAMALAETGDFEQAVRWQASTVQALRDAGDRGLTQRAERRLASYRDGVAWREPWSDDDPIHFPQSRAQPAQPRRSPVTS